MRFIKWCLGMFGFSVLIMPALTEAFDIELTPELIKEASAHGKEYKGRDVFNSPAVRTACFGKYPDGEGGLIMTKYIEIAVLSAMLPLKDKTITDEDIKEIEASTTFRIVVVVPAEDIKAPEEVQITLQQGTNIILPLKNEFGMQRKDKMKSVVGTFQYDKISPSAGATISVKTRNTQEKYKIDFSDIK